MTLKMLLINCAGASMATLTNYLWTIVYMPKSLRILCLTNLFCWMSLVCYSLYFTDFVGEAVFGGDPSAAPGSEKRILYDQGVQFGCWGNNCLFTTLCFLEDQIQEKVFSTSDACFYIKLMQGIQKHGLDLNPMCRF